MEAVTIMEAGKSKICRVGWQAKAPEESWFYNSDLKAICSQNSHFLQGLQSFKIFNWLDMAHPHMKGNLLYSKPIDLNAMFIKKQNKTSSETSRIVFGQISGYHA